MTATRLRIFSALLLLITAAVRAAEGEAAPPKAPDLPAWKLQSEEHWIVDETARAITELLAFAKDRKAAPVEMTVLPDETAPQTYQLTARLGASAVSADVVWKDFIWSPEEHAVWAAKLCAEWKLTATPAAPGEAALLQALTEPTPKILLRERTRLSAALTKTPLDPSLHVQAALVTEAFALRESARYFTDIRRELCRSAAHLAIARALAPADASPARRLAEAALQTLTGRQTPALAALTALDAEPAPGVPAWVRALRLRTTGDWRTEPAEPTLFEQLEIFRARAENVGGFFAFGWLKDRKPAPVHDWRRIMLSVSIGVELGHQFAKSSIPQEITSLEEDHAGFFGSKLAHADVVTTLNTTAQRAIIKNPKGVPSVSVLGWDFWSAQHQRHLCQSIRVTNTFLRDAWGVDEYRDVQKFVRDNFAALTLFPVIDRELTGDASRIPAIAKRMSRLLETHPELIGRSLWNRLRFSVDRSPALPDIISPRHWLRGGVAFGTVYDFEMQVAVNRLPEISDTAWWDALLTLAPTNLEVRGAKLHLQSKDPATLAVVEANYGPMQDYSIAALSRISAAQKKENSQKFIESMERICQWKPDAYFGLGDYFLEQNQPERAAEAYQRGVDLSEDRVGAANECEWLVNYLYDYGKAKEALAIATMAAEVYSYAGLATMARLQEKMGNLPAAEDYYQKIDERYERFHEANAFYRRHRAQNPEYETRAAALDRAIFPKGQIKVTLADLHDAPTGGTVLAGANESTRRYDLAEGDVIVALDGILAESRAQYTFLRASSKEPKMRLIVWTAKGYREIEVELPGRLFGVDILDLQNSKRKAP